MCLEGVHGNKTEQARLLENQTLEIGLKIMESCQEYSKLIEEFENCQGQRIKSEKVFEESAAKY